MKKTRVKFHKCDSSKWLLPLVRIAAAFMFCIVSVSATAQTIISSDTTVSARQTVANGASLIYKVGDGKKLTFTASGITADGGLVNIAAGGYFEVTPETTSGTVTFAASSGSSVGLVIHNSGTTKISNALFSSNTTTGGSAKNGVGIYNNAGLVELNNVRFESNNNNSNSGSIYITGAAAKTNIINAQFINNRSLSHGGAIYIASGSAYIENALFQGNSTDNVHVAGALMTNGADAKITLKDVDFKENYAKDNGIAGAVRSNGAFYEMTNGSFLNNWAEQYAGALHANLATGVVILNGVSFEKNRSGLQGGAMTIQSAFTTGSFVMTNVSIKDNWTAGLGGAIYNNGATTTSGVVINMTQSGTYTFSGNYAGALTTSQTLPSTVAQVQSGISTFDHKASGGGFYFSTAATRLYFNIAENVLLNIGTSGNADDDTLASSVTTATIAKTGAGTLVLHGNNTYWQANVSVNEGSLILGNAGAGLGGAITVAGGATFGGSGTLTTFSQAGAALATKLTAAAGSTIQVGLGGATDKLSLNGNFSGAAGVTFIYDLFADNKSGLFETGTFNLAGTGTIKLNSLSSGTFTLISWTDTNIVDASSFNITGGSGARVETTGTVIPNAYQIIVALANSSSLAWTGNSGTLWQVGGAEAGWSGTTSGGAVTDFQHGDTVFFDATVANRAITIEAAEVGVGGMNVSGDLDYTFNGGGINSTGALVKSGTGTLTFGNAGNTFTNVDISGGVIAFSNVSQLGGATSDIQFSDNATLRTHADAALANNIIVAAGKAAVIDTNGHNVAHSGNLTGLSSASSLTKTGSGALSLSGNNVTFDGTTLVTQGSLLLTGASAKLGGSVMTESGVTVGGSGEFTGNVNIAAGAILQVGTDSSIANLTINSLSLNGGTILFDLYSGQTADTLNITSLTSITGSNVIDIAWFQQGPHVIASGALSAGGISMDSFGVTIGGRAQTGSRQTITLSILGSDLIATGSSDSSRALTWTGSGSASTTWDAADSNWTGGASRFADGDRVLFDDTSSAATHDITIAGSQMMVSDMFVTTNGEYSFTGAAITADAASVQGSLLTGATGKLVKDGTGVLTLANSGMNDFRGGIDLKAGTIKFASVGASGTGAINVIGASTTIQMGMDGLEFENAINLGGNVLVIDTQAHNASFGGVIAGTGGITKNGSGTLILNTAGSYTGATTVAAGVFKAGAIDVAASSNSLEIKTGATFDLGGFAQTVKNLNGAGAVALGSSDLTVMSNADSTFAGSIAGTGKLIKTGASTFTINGANTFSGGVDVQAGVLSVGSSQALGSGAVAIGSSATLEFRNVSSGVVTNSLVGNAVSVVDSEFTLGGANTLGRLTIGSGGKLTANGVGALGGAAATVTVANGGALTLDTPNAVAQSMTVQTGGRLAFANAGPEPLLYLSDTLVLEKDSTIALASIVHSGSSTLVHAAGGVTDNGALFDPGSNMDIIDFIIDRAGNVSVLALDKAANPGKDIAAIYDAMGAASDAVYSRLSESFLVSLDREQDAPTNSVWLKGVGSFAKYNCTPDRIGYIGDTYGLVAGFDSKISENLFVGAYFGYLTNKVTTGKRSESDSNIPHVGIYGAIRHGAAYISGDVMVGHVDADTMRREKGGFVDGSFKALVFDGSLETGFVLGAWENGSIKPAVALHYMSISYNDQKESGLGSVSVDDFNDNRLESLVSIQINHGFDTPWKRPGIFHMIGGWRATLKEAEMNIRGHFPEDVRRNFIVTGEKYNRDGLMVGLGLRFSITDKSSLGVAYDYEMGRDFGRHNVNATIRFAW